LLLVGVTLTTLRFSDAEEFIHLLRAAEPRWLIVASILQVATYWSEGETWRCVTRFAKTPVSTGTSYQLSLAKHFVDQAIPSGGISGTVLVARAIEREGVSRSVVMADVIVNTTSFYIAYDLSLVAALTVVAARGGAGPLLIGACAFFAIFGVVVSLLAMRLSGMAGMTVPHRWTKVRWVKNAFELLAAADARITRNPRVLFEASAYQLSVVLLDAATLWALLASLGGTASPSGVFASFILSTLVRFISIVPGGLGAFEAVSIMTLNLAGSSVPEAVSATLLFRGLSFWLPLLPGVIVARRLMRRSAGVRGAAEVGRWRTS
jgi:Mg2+-importing ATPase